MKTCLGIDPSPPDRDDVVVVPQSALERGGAVTDSRLPFDLDMDDDEPLFIQSTEKILQQHDVIELNRLR